MTGEWLDIVLVIAIVGYILVGFRQGFIVASLSLVGFLGGAAVAMLVLPGLVDGLESGVFRAMLLLVGVALTACLGQGAAAVVGTKLRNAVTWQPARLLDAVFGAIAGIVAVSLVTWVMASALRGGPSQSLSRAVAQSGVVATIDTVVPEAAGDLFREFRSTLETGDFPRVFAGLQEEQIVPVEPPSPNLAVTPEVEAAGAGIVKITGVAEECDRGQEGSGFVAAPGRVVTNAHVVAGTTTEDLRVQVGGRGERLPATVVLFDPNRDLAVLDVPGLTATPLPLATSALGQGSDAIVAGFPLDGPYDLESARVRELLTAQGEDIYGNAGVVREVFSLYARVEPGNSGGPLLTPAGEVAGVVFATSLDDPLTGYALTLTEAAPVLSQVRSADEPVGVGRCIPS